jgi:hypothetical protein
MKSIKVSELTGAVLDWAVAKCEGRGYVMDETEYAPDGRTYQRGTAQSGGLNYSSDWPQGGPIIEREGISIVHQSDQWSAQTDDDLFAYGPTPLIASMRCYVASKMGDTIEVPEELL